MTDSMTGLPEPSADEALLDRLSVALRPAPAMPPPAGVAALRRAVDQQWPASTRARVRGRLAVWARRLRRAGAATAVIGGLVVGGTGVAVAAGGSVPHPVWTTLRGLGIPVPAPAVRHSVGPISVPPPIRLVPLATPRPVAAIPARQLTLHLPAPAPVSPALATPAPPATHQVSAAPPSSPSSVSAVLRTPAPRPCLDPSTAPRRELQTYAPRGSSGWSGSTYTNRWSSATHADPWSPTSGWSQTRDRTRSTGSYLPERR
jgi:hypothetical protein